MNKVIISLGDYLSLVMTDEYDEMLSWMKDNVASNCYTIEMRTTTAAWRVIEFIHKEDLIMFKLKFGL